MFTIHVLSAIEVFPRTTPKQTHDRPNSVNPVFLTIRFSPAYILCKKGPQLSNKNNGPMTGVCGSWSKVSN